MDFMVNQGVYTYVFSTLEVIDLFVSMVLSRSSTSTGFVLGGQVMMFWRSPLAPTT